MKSRKSKKKIADNKQGTVRFKGKTYNLVLSDHAHESAATRVVDVETMRDIVQTGSIKPNPRFDHKFWVSKDIEGRNDNRVSLPIVLEGENLVVVTVLINFSEQE